VQELLHQHIESTRSDLARAVGDFQARRPRNRPSQRASMRSSKFVS
jgi:hypothetical protein